jgi:HlyD family type I secretion membrane fusion protein
VLEGKIDYLLKNNETLEVQNIGLTNQITTSETLLKSYKNELVKWKKLLKADAVDEMKAIDTERRIMQASLELESLKSKINENLTTIKSNQSQIFLEKATFENTAMQEANELKQKNELIYNDIQSLEHMIKDAVIVSPSEGQVTDLKIYATGEVVSPQRPIMSIVPNNQNLMIEAFVLPMDIERVYAGQEVEISFPAYISPSALPMKGKITYVSADTITPENEKESFYTILIKITPDGLDAIEKNGFTIVPGMPSTAFVKTGKQTFMAYLMNPFVQIFKGIYNAN